jgi:hypothetical protein
VARQPGRGLFASLARYYRAVSTAFCTLTGPANRLSASLRHAGRIFVSGTARGTATSGRCDELHVASRTAHLSRQTKSAVC